MAPRSPAAQLKASGAQGDHDGGHRPGEAIAGITNLLDPDMVVIGGTQAGTKWRAAVQEGFERQIPLAQRSLPILAAELGGHAPLIGAAEDLLDYLEDVEAQQELDEFDDA